MDSKEEFVSIIKENEGFYTIKAANVNQKALPLANSQSTPISPLCLFMISAFIYSPNPKPEYWLQLLSTR